MTTGGTSQVAYLHEPEGDYMGSPSDSDYKTPGRDATLDDITMENAIQRLRQPENPETVEAVATTFEGAIQVSFDVGNAWWHNHVFGGPPTDGGESAAPYSYTWTLSPGEVQSSRWYAGVDYASGTAERELKGVVFGSLSIQCQLGEVVTAQLTGFYGDEALNTSMTPGSQPSEQADPLVYHGGSLEIPDGTGLNRMQSATLDIQTGARPQRDWSRHPAAAVMGAVETTLNPTKIVQGTDLLELAYGGTSSPASSVDGAASATLAFTSSGDAGLTYNMTDVTPDSHSWPNFGSPGEDVTEDSSLVVNQIEAVAESSESTAR